MIKNERQLILGLWRVIRLIRLRRQQLRQRQHDGSIIAIIRLLDKSIIGILLGIVDAEKGQHPIMSIELIKLIPIIYRAQPPQLEAKDTKLAIANLYQ